MPEVALGTQKYCGYRPGGHGLYTAKSFSPSLPVKLVQSLIKAANNSVSTGTWKQYKSARKHLERCQSSTGRRMNFPMTEDDVLCLIAYLFDERGLKGKTVSRILSAIR